jgi:AcrR family transcriptional regulator
MATQQPRSHPLTVDLIVDAAAQLVRRDGLASLSMRRLGAALGVDPMAVYHHIAGKRELLALLMERTLGDMAIPDERAPWADRVQQWAVRYWDVVAAHRELALAGLADPRIGAAGLPSTEPLLGAIAQSGLPRELVEPIAFLVVDAVHGSALAVASPAPGDELQARRASFAVALRTIVTALAAHATSP